MVNEQKSELIPSHDFVFVGYRYLTQKALVLPSNERISKLPQPPAIRPASAGKNLAVGSRFDSSHGEGRLYSRELQINLREQWSQIWDPPSQLINLSPAACHSLRLWFSTHNLTSGSPFRPQPSSKHLSIDASTEGWGAHLDFQELSGLWEGHKRTWHINRLELDAVFLALLHWQSQLIGHTVLVSTDNSAVVAYINKQGGTKSKTLCRQATELLLWSHAHQIALVARHIPGRLNVLADLLSRPDQILTSEWSLAPRIFKRLMKLWDSPMVDLFATRWNFKLPLFVSPIPDPQAWSVDALTTSWEGLYAYAYPHWLC